MKKKLSVIFAFSLCLTSSLFVGCSKRDNSCRFEQDRSPDK